MEFGGERKLIRLPGLRGIPSGLKNTSTSVTGHGNTYTVPQTGTYFYSTAADNAIGISELVPKVNGVARGTSMGSNGCLAYYTSYPKFVAYMLDLNAGDVVTGRAFNIQLMI